MNTTKLNMNKRKHSEIVEEIGFGVPLGYESNKKTEVVVVADDIGGKSVDVMRDADGFIQNLRNLVKLPRIVQWISATEVNSGNTLSAFRFNNVETVGEAMKKAGFRSSKYTTLLRQLSAYGFHGFGDVTVKGLHSINRSSVFLHPYAFNRMGDTDYKAIPKKNDVSTRRAKRSKDEFIFTKCLKNSTQVSPTDNLFAPAAISNNIIKFAFVKEVPKVEDEEGQDIMKIDDPPVSPAAQAQGQFYVKNNKLSSCDFETQVFNHHIDNTISSTSFLGAFDGYICHEAGDEQADKDNTISSDDGSFDEITEEEIPCPTALADEPGPLSALPRDVGDLVSGYVDTEAVWFDYFIEQWS